MMAQGYLSLIWAAGMLLGASRNADPRFPAACQQIVEKHLVITLRREIAQRLSQQAAS